MSNPHDSLDHWLLDDHLNQLSAEERAQLSDAMRSDPQLAERHRRLQQLLEPLDSWTTPPAPVHLENRILERIAVRDQAAPVAPQPATVKTDRGGFRRPPLSFREMIAVAAVIALLGLIFVPGMSHVRSTSQRAVCASHLTGIGQGVALYSGDHDGMLPLAHVIPGAKWLRTASAGGPYSPNSRSTFLLLRFAYVSSPDQFICPSDRKAEALTLTNPHALVDFADERNRSFDSLNAAGPVPTYGDAPRQPYMADANPLFINGRFNLIDPDAANSPNHSKLVGQNVLSIDGSVTWHESPRCGRKRDNIWQAGAVRIYKGTETQISRDDTFLVP